MRIIKLRASFGKLRGELNLEKGFNLLCLPNEAGKSTWSAFLVAMLYGVDTSERANAANQGLPAKERYKPWDGAAMEGAAELEWNGRRITIERTTTGRVPMGAFRAYETDSGLAVPELTAENCGAVLCGAERSVFERTAFIRQLGLPVTGDAALEKRLGALVATGEEGGKSYLELEKELRGIKNRLIGRAGRVPRLTERAFAVQKTLAELRTLQENALRLTARREEAEREHTRLTELQTRVTRAQTAQKRAALLDLIRKEQEQEARCRRLRETVEALPEEADLKELRHGLLQAESELQTARIEAAFGFGEPVKPVSRHFAAMDGEEAKAKAASEAAEYERLRSVKKPRPLLPLLLCAVLLSAGAGLCLVSLPAGFAVLGAGAAALVASLIFLARGDARARESLHRSELILTRYGVGDCSELTALAERYAQELEEYNRARTEAEKRKAAAEAAVRTAQEKIAALMAKTARFAPDCKNAEDCREAISAALRARESLETETRALDGIRQQCASMRLILGEAEDIPEDREALTYDTAKLAYELRQAAQRLEELTTQCAALQGAISAKGDAVALEAEAERLAEDLSSAREQSEAVDLALVALRSADETLRSRFSPQITAEAGRLLARLTEEKYPNVLLEPDMRLSVREAEGTVMRPAAAMSCGTADQMYLALRLAMCHRLLRSDAPLILDDALVNFDDARAAAALRLLREEAQDRQVVLFTCRTFTEE